MIEKLPAGIRVEQAPVSLKSVMRHLLTAYLADFARQEGREPEREESGHIPYRYFEGYWSQPDRIPFVFLVADEPVGFCFLRDTGAAWSVAEFYVIHGYRRRGIGSEAVRAIKEYCRRTRTHSVLEASTLRWNESARAFWLGQGFQTAGEDEEKITHVIDLGELADRTK